MSYLDDHDETLYRPNSAQFLFDLRRGTQPILRVLGHYGQEWSQADRDRAIEALVHLEHRSKLLRERLESMFSTTFRVVNEYGRKVTDTDDWLEAQRLSAGHPGRQIQGTHPSHDWDTQRERRCRACGGYDNGSYGSQLPCGYDSRGRSLAQIVVDELTRQEQRETGAGS